MAHTHYKGTGKVHSFRGLMADVAGTNQQKIRIQGPTGDRAWRITKFEIIPEAPGTAMQESIVKIFREKQDTIDGVINFADNELLACGYAAYFASQDAGISTTVVFDNALFVRNIWVTHIDIVAALSCNYYIELEEVKVSQAGMAQLAVAAARRTIG